MRQDLETPRDMLVHTMLSGPYVIGSTSSVIFAYAAYLRVRPAYAGEGRYFVRVPPGQTSYSTSIAVRLSGMCWRAVQRYMLHVVPG